MAERSNEFWRFLFDVCNSKFALALTCDQTEATLGLEGCTFMFIQTGCRQHVYCDSFGRGERSDPLSGMDCTLNIHSDPVFWFPFIHGPQRAAELQHPSGAVYLFKNKLEGVTWFIYSVYCLLSVLGFREWIKFLEIFPPRIKERPNSWAFAVQNNQVKGCVWLLSPSSMTARISSFTSQYEYFTVRSWCNNQDGGKCKHSKGQTILCLSFAISL